LQGFLKFIFKQNWGKISQKYPTKRKDFGGIFARFRLFGFWVESQEPGVEACF